MIKRAVSPAQLALGLEVEPPRALVTDEAVRALADLLLEAAGVTLGQAQETATDEHQGQC